MTNLEEITEYNKTLELLPSWKECDIKKEQEIKLNPLELIIYNQEPSGVPGIYFRKELINLIKYIKEN